MKRKENKEVRNIEELFLWFWYISKTKWKKRKPMATNY